MAVCLNTESANKMFRVMVHDEYFVDKSGLIEIVNARINTMNRYLCVTKPRRFGKTSVLNMLGAYYCRAYDTSALFERLNISKSKSYREHLNRYNVIHLCLNRLPDYGNAFDDYISIIRDSIKYDIQEAYPKVCDKEFGSIVDMLAATGDQFIFIIDEWDYMFSHELYPEHYGDFLEFLRNLLKDQPYVALAYMTGILPVKKYGEHSALNMFWEYSMTDQKALEEYTGFTDNEVKMLCQQYKMDFAETSSWYDGYIFTKFQHIYNPRSVVEAMSCHKFSNYWTSTEVYDALKTYIEMDFCGLRESIVQMLAGARIKVNTLSFKNDMHNFKVKDDVLTLLIHLGYLAYDSAAEEAFIPNKEIIREFENAMSVGGWAEVVRVLNASEKLLNDTLACDSQSVADGLDRAHTEVSSILTYNDENSLSCAIGLAYYSARKDYKIIREFPTGKGFADIVFLPLPHANKPALVIELKYAKTAQTALQQIKDRHYTQSFEDYSGEILLIGINYDKDNKNKPHCCVIESVRK